jgi:hypothetical protein
MLRRVVTALITIGTLAIDPPLGAADERLQGSLTTITGVTDNVRSASDPPPAGTLGPEFDSFMNVSPSLRLSIERARAIHVLEYVFSANLYLEHSEANSYSNRLAWQAAFNLTPTGQLMTGVSATQGELNTFDATLPAPVDPTPLPAGSELYLNADAYQAYVWDVTSVWHAEQNLRVAHHRSLEDPALTPTTWDLNLGFAIERAWKYDSGALLPRFGYTITDYSPTGVTSPTQHLMLTGLEARWRHDIGNYWTSELRAGAVMLFDAEDAGHTAGPFPSGAGILRYVHPEGTASLTVGRAVRANLFTGSNYLAEEAILYGALPLRPLTPRLTLTGSATVQRGRAIEIDTGELAQTTLLYLVDVGLAYELSAGMSLAGRYQYHNQDNEDPAGGGPGDYQRHTAVVMFTLVYPTRPAAAIPFRAPLRVDREDQTPYWNDERQDPARQPVPTAPPAPAAP